MVYIFFSTCANMSPDPKKLSLFGPSEFVVRSVKREATLFILRRLCKIAGSEVLVAGIVVFPGSRDEK